MGTRVAVRLVALLLLTAHGLCAQQSSTDGDSVLIVFHVTSVKRDVPPDWCTTGACSATRFTVEGYAKVPGDAHFTEYTLTCVETIALSPQGGTNICPRVRANGSYNARLLADAIDFIDKTPRAPDAPMEAEFEIRSEREVITPSH